MIWQLFITKSSSFHCELASSTSKYLISDCDFLDPSPVVFMAPDIPPSHKGHHGYHRNRESPKEGLLPYYREEHVCECTNS